MTLAVGCGTHGHLQFIEGKDLPQTVYEKARKAALDRRFHLPEAVSRTLDNHGVAGIFLNPESLLTPLPKRRTELNLRRGTALYNSHLDDHAFETIARSLAEGVGVSTTARIQNVNKKTVLLVLAKASEHVAKINDVLLQNLFVSECQLDEMWSFIGKKERHLDAMEKMQGILGDAWIWIAFDAVNKVFLVANVGKRTLPYAVEVVKEVNRITSRIPLLFSSDQLPHNANALLQVYGKKAYPPHKKGPGRKPNSRLIPPDKLLYVQVVKQYKGNRVSKITRKIIFGNEEKVDEILAESLVSRKINTAYVERGNGTIRHMNARCNRKTLRFSKLKQNHERQLKLSLAYYHLCCPHRTLTKRYGRSTTPFMAAGLSDHIWSIGEMLKRPVKIQGA